MVELTGKIKLLLKHGFLSEFSFGDLLEQLENSDSEAKVVSFIVSSHFRVNFLKVALVNKVKININC